MFKRGDRIILETSVNAIPAGCYRFLRWEDGLLWFDVGSRIKFAITADIVPMLRKVFAPAAFTSPNEFVPKYYALLNQIKDLPNNPNGPHTICCIDPSMPIVQRFETSFPFETRQ